MRNIFLSPGFLCPGIVVFQELIELLFELLVLGGY